MSYWTGSRLKSLQSRLYAQSFVQERDDLVYNPYAAFLVFKSVKGQEQNARHVYA